MTNSIKHFGIIGMHWGIRKSSSTAHPDSARVSSLRKKKLNELSNEELKALTNRMQLEKSYKELSKTDVSLGSKLAGQLIQTLGNVAANQISSVITKQINQAFQDMMANKKKG